MSVRSSDKQAPACRRLVGVAAALALIWVAVALLIPVVESVGQGGTAAAVASAVRFAYAPLCHQEPDRSLWLAGRPLAVCARCTGLYLGGVAGLLVMVPLLGRRPRFLCAGGLLAASLPTLVDIVVGQAGGPGLPNIPRFLIALPPGLFLGMFLAEALGDFGRTERWPWLAPRPRYGVDGPLGEIPPPHS